MASDPKFVKAVPTSKQRIKRVSGDFLWVNVQDDKSQNREAVRSKQSFVRTRHHRLQREKKSLQSKLAPPATKCRLSTSKTGLVGESAYGRYELSTNQENNDPCPEQSVILPSLEVGVLDGLPDLVIHTKNNPNVYFQHYQVFSARSCFPLCPSELTFWFWRKVLDDPPLMQIKLSISASHRAAILKASGAPSSIVQKPTQDTLRLRLGMIKSIQEIFRDESKLYTESTVFSISHLIVSEGFDANIEAVEAHMNGMIKIIAVTGGLNKLDGGTLSMIYSCVFLHGMIKTRSRPAVSMCAKFENRVLEQSMIIKASNRAMNTKASVLGARFFNAPWSDEIQPKFKSLISWYQQLVSYYENLSTISAEPMSVENDCLLYLTHRLLSLPHEITLTPFEEIVRLSILVYSSIRVWTLYGMPCLEVLLETLQHSLCKSYRTLQGAKSDLLFWILFVGSLASRGMECHSWFLAHLVDVADQLSLEGWGSAISVLQGFLFVCRSSDEPAKELWNFTLRGGSMTGLGIVTSTVHNNMVIR